MSTDTPIDIAAPELPRNDAPAAAARVEDAFVEIIARELGLRTAQVKAADGLFAEGATVPFVARYRKEVTGGVEDEKLEQIVKRREYFMELAERRDSILASIASQGKLDEALERAIREAVTKQSLEDLYLPYKPKRRTRAQAAREKGLEPLADALVAGASEGADPEELAAAFVDAGKSVESAADALAGARDILAERVAESAEHRADLRDVMAREATLRVQVIKGKEETGKVYRDYFDYREPLKKAPSHRFLAILRGEREGVLVATLQLDDEREVSRLKAGWDIPIDSACGAQIAEATEDGFKRLLRPSISQQVRSQAREAAEAEAIRVFRENLEALLMQPPIGQVPVMGVDPGYRTGCKVAVVDGTGRLLATSTIFPTPPKARPEHARKIITEFSLKYGVRAIAVGNGTGSRETERFVRGVLDGAPAGNGATKPQSAAAAAEAAATPAADGEEAPPEAPAAANEASPAPKAPPVDPALAGIVVAIVPETGASVYSASALARDELPGLDVSLRGAVSIARRLQDPLAELVKIDPKSLGVGQYQHDVTQKALERELDIAVEGVVNRVGVELNTASPALLRRVSGLSESLAKSVVAYRDEKGTFPDRRTLLAVSGFGPKTFEQAAGFLRVRSEPPSLDATAVHPERYELVETMANVLEASVSDLVGNPELVAKLEFSRFIDEAKGVGEFTLQDIRAELANPGRDPRPEFRVPEWRDDVTSIADLDVGMVLEGRVSNVTNFGAFVDIGVKRDGLVHLSELSHRWVEDPRSAIHVGDIVKVKVMEIDADRGRITLSVKALQPKPERRRAGGGSGRGPGGGSRRSPNGERGRARGGKQGGRRGGAKETAKAGAPAKKRRRGERPKKSEPKPNREPTKSDLDELLGKFKRQW